MCSPVRLVLMAILLVFPVAGKVHGQTEEKLGQLARKYWDATMEHYPTWASGVGDKRFNDRLEDVSSEARRKWAATLNALLRELGKLPLPDLSGEDRLTHELLQRSIRDRLLRIECHPEYTPLNPLNGPQVSFPMILVSQPFGDLADFRAYVSRLRAFPKLVSDSIRNMRTGVQYGIVPPCVIIEKVIPQIRSFIVSDVTTCEFYAPATQGGRLSEADRKTVVREITRVIASDVLPAYLQLLAFVEDEYLPLCRSTVGIGSLPYGDKLYEWMAYLYTTVRLPLDEIHKLGLAEVARIRGEMAKVQADVGYDGTLDEFLVHVRTDPQFRFGSGQELVAAADQILKRTKPRLPELFGRLPKAECAMKEIESFRAASSPAAYYYRSPEDGTRPGYFYINTHAPHERLRFTLEALTYHEAIPGHHFQAALDQENSDLPKFRRYGGFTAYVEGWALYSEKLGYEIGGYQDPYSRFGQLTFEMWRACRLVVDTGIHHRGWSRQRAIDYMTANTSLALLDIGAEVDRYIAWPGQALAYKVGELRILQLRTETKRKLGDKFDLRAFHDALLEGGAMPIDILERRMRDWIESQTR